MRKLIIWLMKLTIDDLYPTGKVKMYRDGEKNPQSGLYYDKTNQIIPLSRFEKFPPNNGGWYLLFRV